MTDILFTSLEENNSCNRMHQRFLCGPLFMKNCLKILFFSKMYETKILVSEKHCSPNFCYQWPQLCKNTM